MRTGGRGVAASLVRGATLTAGVGATVGRRVTATAVVGTLRKDCGGGEDDKCECSFLHYGFLWLRFYEVVPSRK